ncbi:gasdermin-A2-like [Trichosurus vulpecula]|uniref:gasdermin-A2-like n=1 Tax=Trichosurus vulpecula TaxID=9337 RepID=UPI00186B3E34|nr:gasdermin-A2-like [Trichosurus vulpecula]
MSSISEMTTRSVVHKLNQKGDLIPLDSLTDVNGFHCCPLVCKRERFFPFFKPRYWKTEFTVDDLLEASDELDCVSTEVKEKKNYRTEDNVKVKMKMNITLNIPQVTSLDEEAEFSTVCDFKLKSFEISQEGKEFLSHWKLKKEQPSLLETLKKAGENLYMVIETVELSEEQKVLRKYLMDTLFQCLMGRIQGHINLNSTVTIPSGSALAFKLNLLVFDEKCCTKGGAGSQINTSPKTPGVVLLGDPNSSKRWQTKEPSQPLENCGGLQEKDLNWELRDLTEREWKDVLDLLRGCLQDGALGEVEEKVRSPPPIPCPTLSILFNDCESFMMRRGDAILYLLEALAELKELQQKLLVVIAEEGLSSEPMELVEDILMQTSKSGPGSFSLKADSVTHTLVRMCDPEYKLDLSVTWNSETYQSLCALYTALSVLLLLAQSSSSVL